MKKFKTNQDRLNDLKKRGDLIKESFQKEFNKIKRLDEGYLDPPDYGQDEEIEGVTGIFIDMDGNNLPDNYDWRDENWVDASEVHFKTNFKCEYRVNT